ncbi:Thioesterase domain [Popillia japonica]|uniref:oleoyl-[acyl-carrier-protein] hydrolase n=1 Tax=Popillia japonica TaxID=7064 RepID=A0AAW1MKQ2_POPJA
MARRILFWNVIRKQWLLVGIVICIIFACIYPKLGSKEGPLIPEITVKYISVPVIFLVSGISLRTETLFYTFQQYKLHLFVQIFTFVCIPIFMQFLVIILRIFGVNPWILKGLITVACMPPPVSSAVLLTKSAQGNETAAIFNSVLGSFLGILVTPISLLFNVSPWKRTPNLERWLWTGTGKHIGKVLIKIREEEPDEIHPVPQTSFTAYPRFLCKPDSSYLICGGLGGFGLELADLLVVRGAKKLILTSRSGLCNGYQKYRIRIWESYGVTVITTKGDATTEESCSDLLNVAQKLGPLDGIFNLAAVLKDAAFENLTVEDFKVPLVPKAVCTRNLDKFSRELCPNLRYFVVFSSISCGRGNIGQTNYGMANSIMERICENRKKDGYPALAIQWGAIGEVGLVAKMQEDHRELVISGTLQQRISSCLQVLDNFLTQDEPIVASMLVAEKRYGGHANNLFDAVLNIMGVTNLKSVSMHATFPELGMDSMTAVEIKQTMEREYELFLTAQDIRGMTLSKLRDIANAQQPAAEVFAGKKDDIPMEIKLLLSYMSKGELLTKPLTEMETSVEASDEAAPHVFVIPGLDGTAAMLEQLCRKLKAHATCLSYPIDVRIENINEISEAMLPYIESYPGDLIILAYSYGTAVATELMHMLEAKGRTAKIIFVDGSSEFVYGMLKVYFPTEDDRLFQILLLSVLMSRYMRYEEILKHQEIMMKLDSYPRRIEYFINISSRAETSTNYVTEMCLSAYDRLKALSKYKLRTEKLKSPVTLLKANMTSFTKTAADYGLSNVCRDPVKVVTIEGDHASILETDELAEQINWCLEDRAKSG